MALRIGPILYAARSDADRWRFRVRAIFDEGSVPSGTIPELRIDSGSAHVCEVDMRTHQAFPERSRFVATWGVDAERGEERGEFTYSLLNGSDTYGPFDRVSIPARGELPRIACLSCAGFAKAHDNVYGDRSHHLWDELWKTHVEGPPGPDGKGTSPIQLLLGMGDQVYADELAEQCALTPRSKPSPTRVDRARRQFLNLYHVEWFKNRQVARVLARVPGVFTWDDHEIRDGWGSQDGDWDETHGRIDIYRAAREVFSVLQLGMTPGNAGADEAIDPGAGAGKCPWAAPLVRREKLDGSRGAHFLQHLTVPADGIELHVISLDLRSDRTPDRVLSNEQWTTFDRVLAEIVGARSGAHDRPCHLLVVSAIPVVFYRVGLGPIRDLVLHFAGGADDFLDQWEHGNHQGERMRLLKTLLKFRKEANSTVTMVSGDVHVAARGEVKSVRKSDLITDERQAILKQLVSSGIVNQPAGIFDQLVDLHGRLGVFDIIDAGPIDEGDGITTGLLPIDGGRTHVTKRNFLTIRFDDRHKMWARWLLDRDKGALDFQEVVDPL